MLDQSLLALTKCYGNGGSPARIDTGAYEDLSIDEQVLLFGTCARDNVYLPRIAEALRATDGERIGSGEAAVEFIWFMFSQKNWAQIVSSVHHHATRTALPDHIADLYFLARFRLCRRIIVAGTDSAAFEREMTSALDYLTRTWPEMTQRLRLYDAIVANSVGKWDHARSVIAEIGPTLQLVVALSGARTVLPQDFVAGEVEWDLEIFPARADAASLVSVDQTYFTRFAEDFVKAHALSNPGRAVHFHCIGFDPREVPGGMVEKPLVGFSIDRTDLSGLSRIDLRGYYACARFIHAARYLDHYRNLLTSDVDGVLERSIAALLEDQQDADVVLQSTIMEPHRRIINMPWSAVPAAAVLMRATENGRRFADYLSSYLAALFQSVQRRERSFWFADQAALFYAYADLRHSVRFRPACPAIYTQGGDWTLFHGDAKKGLYLKEAIETKHHP